MCMGREAGGQALQVLQADALRGQGLHQQPQVRRCRAYDAQDGRGRQSCLRDRQVQCREDEYVSAETEAFFNVYAGT